MNKREPERLKINYITEINAFHAYCGEHEISTSAIALWYSLMHFCNRTGWLREFSVAKTELCKDTKLSSTTVWRARKELCSLGLVSFIEQTGRKAALYRVKFLSQPDEPVEKTYHGDTQNNGCVSQRNAKGGFAFHDETQTENGSDVAFHSDTQNNGCVSQRNAKGGFAFHDETITKHKTIIKDCMHASVAEHTSDNETSPEHLKQLFDYYQEKVTPIMNSANCDILKKLLDQHGLEMCRLAIDRSLVRGKKSMRYITGILDSWQKNGYEELDDDNTSGGTVLSGRAGPKKTRKTRLPRPEDVDWSKETSGWGDIFPQYESDNSARDGDDDSQNTDN